MVDSLRRTGREVKGEGRRYGVGGIVVAGKEGPGQVGTEPAPDLWNADRTDDSSSGFDDAGCQRRILCV